MLKVVGSNPAAVFLLLGPSATGVLGHALNSSSVSVRRLRNMGALRARLLFTAPFRSQFVCRSEHTCGPKAQQSVDSSRIHTHNLNNTCVLKGRRSNRLSHLLLARLLQPRLYDTNYLTIQRVTNLLISTQKIAHGALALRCNGLSIII